MTLNTPANLNVHVFTEGVDKNTYAYPSLEAFAKGVEACGDTVELITKRKYSPCDIAVIFGDVREGQGKEKRMPFKAEVKGRHIRRGLVVIDTAILTRASAVGSMYRRIGIDGLLKDEADFANEDMPTDRWKKLSAHAGLEVQPWRQDGSHITIALQRPMDASLKSSERLRPDMYKSWLLSVVTELHKKSDLPVHIRPHPGSMGQQQEEQWLESVQKDLPDTVFWDTRKMPFKEAMKECKLCVTYNSGAGVDAALLGVPIMACNAGSFAWDVALHEPGQWNPSTPYTPDREQWLNNLSYVEWNLEEIAQGLPWKHLRNKLVEQL